MIFSELIPLTAALVNFVLTILVMSRGLRSTVSRVYLLWGLSLTIWNFGTFLMFHVKSAESALFWARLLQFGVIFLPITLAHLCLLIGHIKVSRFFYLGYALHTALALSNCTSFFIAGVRDVGYAYYAIAGYGFWILAGTYTIPAITVYLLYQKRKSLPPSHQRRLFNMTMAVGTLIFFGINDSLPILGVYEYPLLHFKIFPFGSAAAIFYGIIVGYSVLQHHLLDIHVTLSQIAARLVRFLFLFLIGLSLLLIITVFAPKGEFTTFSFVSALAVLMASAITASIFFPRVFGGGDEALERRILGDRFEYHDQVQTLIQTMRSVPEPQVLLEELQSLLLNTIKVRSYQLILLDETTRGFTLYYSHPPRPLVQLTDLRIDSPVFRFFQQSHADYLSCNSMYHTGRETDLQSNARQQLDSFEPEFCFPFFSGDDLVGLMLLGSKTNGDLFTPHDLRLLTTLTQELSLLLNQVRLRNQLQIAHEQDLLGRMSRGLAHDLNNLLTPVQTLLQLFQENKGNRDTVDELLPVALRNLLTVRSYVNEALFFSRAATLKTTPGALDDTIREASALVQTAAETKNIAITFNPDSRAEIDMDAVLIKRLLCNLLSNAVDASRPGSQITIQLGLLPKTEMSRDWFRLQIIDQGDGISPENLKRVFTPYFTTKNTGDGKRGFGLGLAIARNIVHLHGGNLSIASKEKKGTTVQVDLPSKTNVNPSQSLNVDHAISA
jgi:signal transduction histidine kinase